MGRNLHRKQTLVCKACKFTFICLASSLFFTNLLFAQSAAQIDDTEEKSEQITEEKFEKIENEDFPEIFMENLTLSNDSVDTENSDESETGDNLTEEKTIEKIELPFSGMDRPEVEKFRQQYLTPKWSGYLQKCLETSLSYRLYVRKSITDKEMPEIIEYLPVVESNYRTNAKSSSGAIGLWQFMANSVYPFLTLNDYVDERYDPWKSTDAALAKLTDNYNSFNDWLIAIAAYNCGLGAMKRFIKKVGGENVDFWTLVDKGVLPSQTANYVPKLLAIADLAINSEYYGIDLPNHNEEYELLYNEKNAVFDYIKVTKAYSLSQLAQELRIDTAYLKELNPSYILGFTHPSKTSEIRLPLGMAPAAEVALASISPIEFPFKYKVVAGDSLWSISRRYGVTIDAICELNGINENAILKLGKILYIPSK